MSGSKKTSPAASARRSRFGDPCRVQTMTEAIGIVIDVREARFDQGLTYMLLGE